MYLETGSECCEEAFDWEGGTGAGAYATLDVANVAAAYATLDVANVAGAYATKCSYTLMAAAAYVARKLELKLSFV